MRIQEIDQQYECEHRTYGARDKIQVKWYKSMSGKRIVYFNQAANAYRNRDYSASLHFFQQALNEEYPEGTPYTDAQIYANMAMAYFSRKTTNVSVKPSAWASITPASKRN